MDYMLNPLICTDLVRAAGASHSRRECRYGCWKIFFAIVFTLLNLRGSRLRRASTRAWRRAWAWWSWSFFVAGDALHFWGIRTTPAFFTRPFYDPHDIYL